MELLERLRALTAQDLAPVVRGVLGNGSWEPVTWSVESPGWTALSPSTRGVFRVRGTAGSPTGEASWTAVLKVLGATEYPRYSEPHEGNYWRREPVALQSGLLQQRAAGLVPVEVLQVAEPVAGEVGLWMECLDPADAKPRWSRADQVAAAEDVGSFNAIWSLDPPSGQEYRGWPSAGSAAGWPTRCSSAASTP